MRFGVGEIRMMLKSPSRHQYQLTDTESQLAVGDSSMVRRFRFVNVSNPTEARSAESKRLAYAHAFRQSHAQKRREQAEKYRNEITNALDKNISIASGEAGSSPLSQLVVNSTRDPFSSLAKPLSSVEYFLLDHCMCMLL